MLEQQLFATGEIRPLGSAEGAGWVGPEQGCEPGTLVIILAGKPMAANDRYRNNAHKAQVVRKYRKRGKLLCDELRRRNPSRVLVPPVELWVRAFPARSLTDAAAIAPAVKAILDGVVDAGFLPDDSGRYVRGEHYLEPVRSPIKAWVTEIRFVPVRP